MRPLTPISALFGLAVLVGASTPAHAGRVVSQQASMAHDPAGFGAWNLGNVSVDVPEGSYDPATGAYVIGPDGVYASAVEDGEGNVTGVVVGKDWPVGEPSGIKVVNDDLEVKEGKPTNCLITTSYLQGGYLDSDGPQQTLCSSPFQSHKRFKIDLQPGSLAGVGVDLVFNVEPDATTRDYQVFEKINNYTGVRLEGFVVQVGVGVGDAFQTASEAGLTTDLSLSAPTEIWDAEDVATFSHGLFGPADMHFPTDGFFDDQRAGFYTEVVEYMVGTGVGDTLQSTMTQGSNYAQVPPVVGPVEQFGPWLPSEWAPWGMFFDDDDDPSTDAVLMAFWGETAADSDVYAWMRGDADEFAVVDDETLATWEGDDAYSVGIIEDLLNVGLNYRVTLGVVDDTWPTWDADSSRATFTIRVIPIEDTSGIGEPGYVQNSPNGMGGDGDGDGDPTGDGDGDPSGDGDGDPTGDGDGDPTGDGDGDPTGDGDGDPTGDGDGDGETGGDGDGTGETGETGDPEADAGDDGCSCSAPDDERRGAAALPLMFLAGLAATRRRRRAR